MKKIAVVLALGLVWGGAVAQDMRPGIASIAVVTSEPEGRYGMDGTVVKPAKLKRTLVTLDEQLAIGHLHLRRGQSDITPAQLAEVQAIADAIGAKLLVEKDGRLEPAGATSPGT